MGTPNMGTPNMGHYSNKRNTSNFGYSPSIGMGGLPDFNERGSFPTFFLTKSGSFDKSPGNSFIIHAR